MDADTEKIRTSDTAADRFRDLIEAAPDAILEVRKDGRIITANAQAERLFRYSRAELLQKTVEDLLPPRFRGRHSAHRDQYANKPILRPMGTGLDLYALRADGTEFAVDINLSPLTADDGQRVVCIIRDVSERKRAEEQIRTLNQNLAAANQALELRNKEVERVNQLKSEFLASMSHELRTPLNTIIGFSDLLAEQAGALFNEKQKRFLGHIRGDAHHLLTLINDILDLSKIEAGRLELKIENFPLTAALDEVLSSVRPLAAQKRVHLENRVTGTETLRADRVRFKEILYNLLSNAIKFTPAEGRIWIEAALRDDQAVLTVGDTGIGILVTEQEAIFDSFHQVGFTTKGVREGTGLGLAITRRLVEQHGGRIWLESQPGEGSQFHFSMPLAELMHPADFERGERGPASLTVLTVEDDAASRELLISYLHDEGIRVITAHTAADAIRKARDQKPDIITLDIRLQDKSGWEVLHELRTGASTSSIPVIVISVMDERAMGLQLGASDYFVKPVNRPAFVKAIRRLSPGFSLRNKTFLIADDNERTLEMMRELLISLGVNVVEAVDGLDALEQLRGNPPDAAILDIQMPGLDGFEVLAEIRRDERLKPMRVVALTASAMQGDAERALAAGFDRYFTKPLDVAAFKAEMSELLSG